MAECCSCRTMAGEPASLGDHQGELTHLRSLAVPYAQASAITTLSR
jgi:hypothetical protein